MDCMGYIISKMRRDIIPRHLWTCDRLKSSRESTANNYVVLNSYTDVGTRPHPPLGMLHTYVAGPPCQGLSTAGLRKAWDDPRTRLYMQSLFAIEKARPRAFVLDHSDQLQTIGKVTLAEAITNKLKQLQYCIHGTAINSSNYSLPQNRSRDGWQSCHGQR